MQGGRAFLLQHQLVNGCGYPWGRGVPLARWLSSTKGIPKEELHRELSATSTQQVGGGASVQNEAQKHLL